MFAGDCGVLFPLSFFVAFRLEPICDAHHLWYPLFAEPRFGTPLQHPLFSVPTFAAALFCICFAFFPAPRSAASAGITPEKIGNWPGPAVRFCRDSTISAGPSCQKCLRSGLAILKARPFSAHSESTSATNTGSGGRRRLRDSPCFGAHFGRFPHCGSQFLPSLLGGSPSLRSPWTQRVSYAFKTAWLCVALNRKNDTFAEESGDGAGPGRFCGLSAEIPANAAVRSARTAEIA